MYTFSLPKTAENGRKFNSNATNSFPKGLSHFPVHTLYPLTYDYIKLSAKYFVRLQTQGPCTLLVYIFQWRHCEHHPTRYYNPCRLTGSRTWEICCTIIQEQFSFMRNSHDSVSYVVVVIFLVLAFTVLRKRRNDVNNVKPNENFINLCENYLHFCFSQEEKHWPTRYVPASLCFHARVE